MLELNPHMISLLEKQSKAYDSLPMSQLCLGHSVAFSLLSTDLGSVNTQNCHGVTVSATRGLCERKMTFKRDQIRDKDVFK